MTSKSQFYIPVHQEPTNSTVLYAATFSLYVCCKYVFKVWHFTLLWQPYFDACTLSMVLLTIIPAILPSIIPAILCSSLNEYLATPWNLDTQMNDLYRYVMVCM